MPITPTLYTQFLDSHRQREVAKRFGWSDNNSIPLYKRLLEVSSRHGIEIPDRTRYRQYMEISVDKKADEKLRITAYNEIYHLLVALENLNNIEEWRSTINDTIRYDSAIPAVKINQSKGRDALFEIYLAGRFSAAGISVSKGEPDILCNKNGFKFGVAAKRIKSKNKIVIRAKEAREQIERSKIPGIIALDLTPLQNEYYNEFPIESILCTRQIFINRIKKAI